MHHGHCSLFVNGEESGRVEYKYNSDGTGYLWGDPETFVLAIHEEDVSLRLDGEDKAIAIRSATPGEAAPFAFKDWRKGA